MSCASHIRVGVGGGISVGGGVSGVRGGVHGAVYSVRVMGCWHARKQVWCDYCGNMLLDTSLAAVARSLAALQSVPAVVFAPLKEGGDQRRAARQVCGCSPVLHTSRSVFAPPAILRSHLVLDTIPYY